MGVEVCFKEFVGFLEIGCDVDGFYWVVLNVIINVVEVCVEVENG